MREMRRKDRLMDQESAMDLLKRGEYGILATVDSDGQPYGVPLSYVVKDDCIYYHSTSAGGSKQDNLLGNDKVSFTVVENTKVLPDQFATLYESVIAFGKAGLVDDEEERLAAFKEFVTKYSPEFPAEGKTYIEKAGPQAIIVKIAISNLTGKARKK